MTSRRQPIGDERAMDVAMHAELSAEERDWVFQRSYAIFARGSHQLLLEGVAHRLRA